MSSNTQDVWEGVIDEVFAVKDSELRNINKKIWSDPEPSLKETRAHDHLASFLESEGFQVERSFLAPTAFRATYELPKTENVGGAGDSPSAAHVCFLCEYDAVGEVGHAAGHNLKTDSSLAAALAIKRCISEKLITGKITLLGTSGEDCGCGTKIDMVNEGVFDTIDICMMLSPFNTNILFPKHSAMVCVKVQYKGKAAHASAFPWEGRNALDAAVACYNNVALMRQQCKPSSNINGIITDGGLQPNTIPQHTELKYWLRAPDHMELFLLQQKCTACFVAAAKATGCEAQFHFEEKSYHPLEHNEKLGALFKRQATDLGIVFSEDEHIVHAHIGSTDLGNVSQVVPCIKPAIDIGTSVVINSVAFHDACGLDEAHEKIMRAAKVMARTAAEVMSAPALLAAIKEEFTKNRGAPHAMLQRLHSTDSGH